METRVICLDTSVQGNALCLEWFLMLSIFQGWAPFQQKSLLVERENCKMSSNDLWNRQMDKQGGSGQKRGAVSGDYSGGRMLNGRVNYS